jgi:hypothetical protein
LKYNTSKVCHFLVQFLLTAVLSIEERVFVGGYLFGEGNRYSDMVQQHLTDNFPQTAVLYLLGAAKCAVCCNRPQEVNG